MERARRAGLRLELDDRGDVAPQVGPACSRPVVAVLRHPRGGGDRVDGDQLGQRVRDARGRLVAIQARSTVVHDALGNLGCSRDPAVIGGAASPSSRRTHGGDPCHSAPARDRGSRGWGPLVTPEGAVRDADQIGCRAMLSVPEDAASRRSHACPGRNRVRKRDCSDSGPEGSVGRQALEDRRDPDAKAGQPADALVEALHSAQEAFGYLDSDALTYVGRTLAVPPSTVFGVATFYHYFTLKPAGEHTAVVCTGTACYINGASGISPRSGRRSGSAPRRRRQTARSRF